MHARLARARAHGWLLHCERMAPARHTCTGRECAHARVRAHATVPPGLRMCVCFARTHGVDVVGGTCVCVVYARSSMHGIECMHARMHVFCVSVSKYVVVPRVVWVHVHAWSHPPMSACEEELRVRVRCISQSWRLYALPRLPCVVPRLPHLLHLPKSPQLLPQLPPIAPMLVLPDLPIWPH